jgi:predicted nucleic acid binding AN1-type Zn finger protein
LNYEDVIMECYYCGKKEGWGFKCHECGHSFCGEHKVPESHNCPYCPTYKPTSPLRKPYLTPDARVTKSIFRYDEEERMKDYYKKKQNGE